MAVANFLQSSLLPSNDRFSSKRVMDVNITPTQKGFHYVVILVAKFGGALINGTPPECLRAVNAIDVGCANPPI